MNLNKPYACSFERSNAGCLLFSCSAANIKTSKIFFAALMSRFQTILQLLLLHFNAECILRFEFIVVILSSCLFYKHCRLGLLSIRLQNILVMRLSAFVFFFDQLDRCSSFSLHGSCKGCIAKCDYGFCRRDHCILRGTWAMPRITLGSCLYPSFATLPVFFAVGY